MTAEDAVGLDAGIFPPPGARHVDPDAEAARLARPSANDRHGSDPGPRRGRAPPTCS